jgi:hypothetical protein
MTTSGDLLTIQPNWMPCSKCGSLYYHAASNTSLCPAGGGHAAADGSLGDVCHYVGAQSSSPFIPPSAAENDKQVMWCACQECMAMFLSTAYSNGIATGGVCLKGAINTHWQQIDPPPDLRITADAELMPPYFGKKYILPAPAVPGETGWRLCSACRVMFRPDPVDETTSGRCWAGTPERPGHQAVGPYYRIATTVFAPSSDLPRLATYNDGEALIAAAQIDPTAFAADRTLKRIIVTDNPTWTYNCVAYSIGVTDRWINPPEQPQAFAELYTLLQFPTAGTSDLVCIDGWAHGQEMVHAARTFPVGAEEAGQTLIMESKVGALHRMTHSRDLFNGSLYGLRTVSFTAQLPPTEQASQPATPPVSAALSAAELSLIADHAGRVADSLRVRFEESLQQWKALWPLASSDTRIYARGSAFDGLVALGPGIAPLIIARLSEADGFVLLPLLERLTAQPMDVAAHPLEGEQSRARRVARAWLAQL